MLNSRDINKLQPYVADRCRRLKEECKKIGIDIIVTGTVRDQEYQTLCFKNGTGPAKLGPHGFGLAFDVVPVVNGKAIWSDNNLWAKIGAIGESLGLEWGGHWKTRMDKPHFEYTQGLSDAQIRAGMLPKFPPITNIPTRQGVVIPSTLACMSAPSNRATRNGLLRQGAKVNIYNETVAEGIKWYLVNNVTPQWMAAKYIKLI